MSRGTLHVVRSLRPETGGVAEAVRHLAEALRARGEPVAVLSLDGADEGRDGVIVVEGDSEGYGYAADYVPWLRKHAREFDAVIVHGMWQYPGFGAWRALRGGTTPYLVYCHGMLDPWFKRTYPLKHVKKWLYWPWAEYRVLRDAAAVCFTCREERRRARESFWLYRAREYVTPIGIPTPPGDPVEQRAAFFRAHPALQGRRFLLFLGRIHPKKGLDLLLPAFAKAQAMGARLHDREVLVIAGPWADEKYRATLQRTARELGIVERVHWLPMIAGDVKWGALRACQALVLPSHQENFGVVVAEALAGGRPVLISDQVNIWREIAGDGAGIAGADTVAGTREILERWMRLNADERAAMSAAARRCFEERFSVSRAVDALIEVVQAARTP